jgi:hypothetical protein
MSSTDALLRVAVSDLHTAVVSRDGGDEDACANISSFLADYEESDFPKAAGILMNPRDGIGASLAVLCGDSSRCD